eukprot:1153088-Pelagomonas_calceolata.AAC.1
MPSCHLVNGWHARQVQSCNTHLQACCCCPCHVAPPGLGRLVLDCAIQPTRGTAYSGWLKGGA